MAQSISDLFARGHQTNTGEPRRARLVGIDRPTDAPADTQRATVVRSPVRRAAFRPAESVALRRDVVEAFAAAMLRDRQLYGDDSPQPLLDAARAAEVLGDLELARKRLENFESSGGQWTWETASLKRRILRQIGDDQGLRRELRAAPDYPGAPAWGRALAILEEALLSWTAGDEAEAVADLCAKASQSDEKGPHLGAFAALWGMQLRCDAGLELGRSDDALRALEEAIALPELIAEVRQSLEARRAVWMHVFGRHHEARNTLDDLARRGTLPGDLDDLLVSLCFEAGEYGRAFNLLRSSAGDRCRLRDHALPLVMLHETAAENPATAQDVLREATADSDDWTLLRLRQFLLEGAEEDPGRAGATELIDVLNRRLEGPLSVDERVTTLTRLGRLYEVEAGLEEAAAEVYREALGYDPRHVPALRALGRLYTRRENWRALAELYEREIATLGGTTAGWRRHYQLGELYEHRLDRDERALENYLIVLEERPNYLPALKSSARILGRLERWTRLADLFLRMVDTAPNRRQKLYLLDKVAEVAEDRLQNFDVAIGAWRETMELDPENPRAFTALGRLFARTHRWEDLIALNEREVELMVDDEEVASIWLRNAEIAEQHLGDLEKAEKHYRRALDVIPDYLPALEALGRIYLRGGRWADIVEMTGRELETGEDVANATRQLGALAEILETKLDRRGDAIEIYERLWQSDHGDPHVFASLARLYRGDQRWQPLCELLHDRLAQGIGATEYAGIQGELATIAEWRLNEPGQAYHHYMAALTCDPANLHWIGGVARTWVEAEEAPGVVADGLEDLSVRVTDEVIRDRYFMVIARLRERSVGGPEASRAYRAHGSAESLENQIVLRLAMAAAGERAQLSGARAAVPHHPLQEVIAADRCEVDESVVAVLARASNLMGEPSRRWLAGELPPHFGDLTGFGDGLTADLVELLDGDELQGNTEQARQESDLCDRRRLRLRALQARRMASHGGYLRWTERELPQLPSSVRAARLLELARYATQHQLPEQEDLYRRACRAVFPEITCGGQDFDDQEVVEIPCVADGHVDRLYAALRATANWELLRPCLEAHVARPETSREARLELFEELARVLCEELDDYTGARDALTHCWQLSENPDYLRRMVVLATSHGEADDALRFQKKHFEQLSLSNESTAAERVQSGMWLAELLLAPGDEDQRGQAIDCLTHLSESYDDSVEGISMARRMLARAHSRSGHYRQAVEIFESTLYFKVRADELEDWRRVVELLRGPLENPTQAYTRQWQIVRAFPSSTPDLDTLIDLAAEAQEMADCIHQLQALASATADESKASLLARAAEAADEELGHAEEAYHLFERVLDLCEEDDPRRLYMERRRAICLSRMAGRETRALEGFRRLIALDPFESANYRGLETLFEQSNAHDRLRITRQTLRMLGCETESSEVRTKERPTRSLPEGIVEKTLIPGSFHEGIFEILQASVPLAEKLFGDSLPQRKALAGRRIKSGNQLSFYDDLQAALLAFGHVKFKLYLGESGPEHPLVFTSSTPVIWLDEAFLERLSGGESRFVAGYCAALVWSGLPSLMALDGREVWHMIEGVMYRQNGQGFSERVDVRSQEMADAVSSPFDVAHRRAIARSVEDCEVDMNQCHCEAWGRELEIFAARAGLLLSGDLAAASRAILHLAGWNLPLSEEATQRRLRNDPIIQDLVELAHSDSYLQLRYDVGLAGRPSRLGI